MKDMKDQPEGQKEAPTNEGIDIESGFRSTKIEIDGFKGKPAKISKKDGSYFSDAGDESQVKEYKEKGYKTSTPEEDKE